MNTYRSAVGVGDASSGELHAGARLGLDLQLHQAEVVTLQIKQYITIYKLYK